MTLPGRLQPVLLVLSVCCCASAKAVVFNIGAIEAQFDSSLSFQTHWSMAGRHRSLVGSANGGSGASQAGDDGRLNFKQGEIFTKRLEGVHALELHQGDSGLFLRGRYWYDFELMDEGRLHKDISDDNRKTAAKSSGSQLLDAFFYRNYQWHELPGTLRLGRQTVRWGESLFIGGGIDAINPRDTARLLGPGTELRDGALPVNLFYLSQSVSDRLLVDGFYQLDWEQDILPNCGTFFSASDAMADGCGDYDVGSNALAASGLAAAKAIPAAYGQGYRVGAEGVRVTRAGDRDARNSGQFGLAMHWLGDSAGFGLYFLKYHSRQAMFGTKGAANSTFAALPAILADTSTALQSLVAQDSIPALLAAQATGVSVGNGRYFLEYPKDIRLYGLSFATWLPSGSRWSGELSYRPNAPVQLNTGDLIQRLADPAAAGMVDKGYRRKEITQVQTALTHEFDHLLGADLVTLVGEAGYVHVGGLERHSRYGRDPVFGRSGRHGFVTSDAWGYRLRGVAEYRNVLPRIVVRPSLAFSHDVDGYGPNGLFNQNAKSVRVGLEAEYMGTYRVGLAYTEFFGGQYNTLVDRDFLGMSIGAKF
ncbi:DUF1302 domain-containing protein [Azomonas macrocytogenes]|uniref:DUF1302 domain-containing protein n=1 Tax=Azomonas macrocytogenes TaxID=69962 RepID=A0A839T890_AZOMA|nr:DUF1302 domain-containing protein [Azomonas macrocytogenes]MBB3104185.1 hypothetical protein [Azomonas macrocytogenes]